ncbi:hypothetical protein [Nocardia amamiensis]|uniref:hypothetical protein n=1 Tax=Nocardia amamiensis TaxID=404578 RepID=UPI00082AEFCF|nr:hypothetical protein [Nocardia amamiensis]
MISVTTAPAVLAYFDSKGYEFAADIFGAYLGNNGPDYEYIISTRNVEKVVKTRAVAGKAQEQLDFIKMEAKQYTDRVGVWHEITSSWEPVRVTDDSDVTLALGDFSVAVGSDVRVQSTEGQPPSAEIRYRIYIYDLYDFDKSAEWSGDIELSVKKGLNHDMRQLEEAGWARSFKARGDTQFLGGYTWSGAI